MESHFLSLHSIHFIYLAHIFLFFYPVWFQISQQYHNKTEMDDKTESHQQFLSLPGLKDNKISQNVHVDVATIVDDVPILAKYPDVVIGQRDSL